MKAIMKKVLSMALVVTLTAGISIGGTLAYLTDRESEANVFTTGNVEIELNEVFEQGAELVPGVRIQKEATITNTGENDAWVWMTVAVPAVLDDENTELGSANVLHWNMPGCFWNGYHKQDKYIQSGIKDGYLPEGSTGVADEDSWINNNVAVKETIDDIEYNVYTFKYVGAIVPGETTNIGLSKAFLDENVDIDTDGQWYIVENGVATKINWNSNTDGSPIIYVSAYAMQKDQFATVEDAYKAYNKQWADKGEEYGTPSVTVVSTTEELVAALEVGGKILLDSDIVCDGTEPLRLAEGITVELDLAGNTITNAVSGQPALINNGTLTISGDGAIVNGTNDVSKSHTIRNYGTLTIESGTIGTDDTAGAAVVNDGTATINGGTFASKQENVKADGLCAYAFINNDTGTMTINDATLDGQTHGLFGAYAGEIIVNGGNYTLDGNGGLGCYVAYATGDAKVTLNGGVINTNEPRSNRVFFVYDNGNHFNADAVKTGKVFVGNAKIYLNGVEQTYSY